MLIHIEDLPANIIGLRAEGKVTRRDYEAVLVPLLEEAHERGERVRFLYQFGSAFKEFTPGAAMDDLRVGIKYFRLFAKCAVVSDSDLIRGTTQFVGSLMPMPVQAFENSQLKEAIGWLSEPDIDSPFKFELRDDGVLIIHPHGPLQPGDFDKLSSVVDPWIEDHHMLHGLVVSVDKFPGWENVGGFIHHIDFIRSHYQKIERVALAMDGLLPELLTKVGRHFVGAKVRQFKFAELNQAVEWVKG